MKKLLISLLLSISFTAFAQNFDLQSPNKELAVRVYLKEGKPGPKVLNPLNWS